MVVFCGWAKNQRWQYHFICSHHGNFGAKVRMQIFLQTLKTSPYCQSQTNAEYQRFYTNTLITKVFVKGYHFILPPYHVSLNYKLITQSQTSSRHTYIRGCPYITSAAITRQGHSECLRTLT